MKFTLSLDKDRDEEVIVFAKEERELIREIKALALSDETEITGTYEDEIVKLDLSQVCCFISENNKTYAMVSDKRYRIKLRLYQIEELGDERFIKINQSCIANIKMVERFKTSIGASMLVEFRNGYVDYIARREVKNVKERMGLN